MFVGLPIGTIVGGLAAAAMVAAFGWQPVFLVGGIVPLAMVPFLFFLLPESPRFLAARSAGNEALAKLMGRLSPSAGATANSVFETEIPELKGIITALFTDGRAPVTVLLWLIFFANLLTMNAILGWLPTLLESIGFPLERAILVTVLFSIGGVIGGLAIALSIDRFGATRTMTTGLLAATIAVILVGQSTASTVQLLVTVFFAGITAMGCQFGLNAMASKNYDTNSRATGLGWALAFGRLGSVVGPILVGAAMAMNLPFSQLFMLGAIPTFLAAGAVLLLSKVNKRTKVPA